MNKRPEHQYTRHTNTHTQWMDVYKGMNVWQVWSLERRSICTLGGPVFLCFILSVSAAQLIHLQLSWLVEQVRGNVVLRQCLNPQSGPAGCAGFDQWSRVTRPGVSVSFALCCFVGACASFGKHVDAPAPSVQLRPHAAAS